MVQPNHKRDSAKQKLNPNLDLNLTKTQTWLKPKFGLCQILNSREFTPLFSNFQYISQLLKGSCWIWSLCREKIKSFSIDSSKFLTWIDKKIFNPLYGFGLFSINCLVKTYFRLIHKDLFYCGVYGYNKSWQILICCTRWG